VVDAVTGLPIAGAELTQELRFVRFTPEAGSASPPPPPRAYSDAAGEFELPWDEPNATSLLLAVVAAGHDRSALFPSERADRGAAPNHMALDLGDVAVMPETTLAGRVLDVASQPVALAHILLVHERGIAEHVAITDNHGAFAVLGIPRLVGSDPWLVAQAGDTLAFARLPVATQVELRCLPTASMCVRVVDETGAAIAGARVVAQAMCLPTDDGRVRVVDGPWPRHHRHATSDRDGVALLAPLPIATKDGQCLLSACADGHRGERRAQALTSGGNAVVVVLPHGMTAVVRGVVVDAATQRPVAGATVGPCRTGADGTFAIADLDVEGGVVRLAASATGYADTHCEEPVGGRVDPQFVRIDLKPATAASEAPPGPTISVPLTGDVQLPEILAPTPRRAPK
jgi:hypothetical protein